MTIKRKIIRKRRDSEKHISDKWVSDHLVVIGGDLRLREAILKKIKEEF